MAGPLPEDKRLQRLAIGDDPSRSSRPLTIYAAHRGDRLLGPAGRWLLDHLQIRLG